MSNKTKQEIKVKKELKKEESYPIKVGLEIHGYLDTKEKLFCECKADANENDKPNSRICPICTGQPGSKPMLPNKKAMEQLIKIALVLDCKINHDKELIWQRKHYSWPDLPKGYQETISGPNCIPCAQNGKFSGIRITECHLEEDPAKWDPATGTIDYNRSGLPLVEIVTEPDFSSSEQVVEWLKKLIHSLSYLKTIRKSGGIKVDTNVSTYGERVEIKNLNSLENIKNAIEYEIKRQIENHSKGIEQKRETLSYDAAKGKTIKMRDKESGEDYRFIPDPDLPAIKLNEKEINQIQRNLPEMPEKKLEKLLTKYKIDDYNAGILVKNLELVDFFEALSKDVDAKKYISWITVELLRILNYNKKTLEDEDINIKPEHLAELIKAIDSGKITELKAKQIMNDFIPRSYSIKDKLQDFVKTEDSEVEKICKQVINSKENEKSVADFKSGKQEALNFLIGQVMKLSNRRADYKTAKENLLKMLKQ